MPRLIRRISGWLKRRRVPHGVVLRPGLLRGDAWVLPDQVPPTSHALQPRREFPARAAMWVALILLTLTTVYWAWFGAQMHAANADQLVDPLLFQSADTLRGASFPATHTFLLKWPLFALVAWAGFAPWAYTAATIVVCLLTVWSFAWLLRRIIKNTKFYAFFVTVISVVLLMVPAVPQVGALLPLGFGMLATRNIEYALFAAALYWVFLAPRLRSWWMFAALASLALLCASDRMFIPLSVGAALGVVGFGLLRAAHEVKVIAPRVLVVSGTAVILGVAGLHAIDSLGTARIVDETVGSPFGLGSLHDMALGFAYAAVHLTTLLGINPAALEPVFRRIPEAALHDMWHPWGATRILLLMGLGCLLWCRRTKNRMESPRPFEMPIALLLVALAGASFTAILQFTSTKHYYAADARYLLIVLPTVGGVMAWRLRNLHWAAFPARARFWLLCGLAVSLVGALFYPPALAASHRRALAPMAARTDRLVSYMRQHPDLQLVGDYWRVVPVRAADQRVAIAPLQSCTSLRATLASDRWAPRKNKVAYLLSYDASLTDFPDCTPNDVRAIYGLPTRTDIVSGTPEQPLDVVFVYERKPAASLPKTPVSASCPSGKTLAVVAHQDDDLLFMNPDLTADLQAGRCVRTVYLTAGDTGSDAAYWHNRQKASESAYSVLGSLTTDWSRTSISPDHTHHLVATTPKHNSQIALYFVGLPDGGVQGAGFAANQQQSLKRLQEGSVPYMTDLADRENYTQADVVALLIAIIQNETPDKLAIFSNPPEYEFQDHSDHVQSGKLALQAALRYQRQTGRQLEIRGYTGYPVFHQPTNLSDEEIALKINAFLAYAAYDPSVCHDRETCLADPAYGNYLTRQYRYEVVQ